MSYSASGLRCQKVIDRQTEVQSPILLQNKILNAAIDAKTVSLPTNSNNLFDQLKKNFEWTYSPFDIQKFISELSNLTAAVTNTPEWTQLWMKYVPII